MSRVWESYYFGLELIDFPSQRDQSTWILGAVAFLKLSTYRMHNHMHTLQPLVHSFIPPFIQAHISNMGPLFITLINRRYSTYGHPKP